MSMDLEDYKKEICSDIRDWLDNNDAWPTADKEKEEDLYDKQTEDIYDHLQLSDSVTGNASGSYTFNTWKAAENISQLIWDDEFWDRMKDFGFEPSVELFSKGPEYIDVSIRCVLLSECLSTVLSEGPETETEGA